MKVVCGYDSSPEAHAALLEAIELAKATDGSIVLVCGRKPREVPWASAWVLSGEAAEAEIACSTAMGEACAEAKAAGVEAETDVIVEEPAQALIQAAERHSANVIVVGSKGEGAVSGALLGSTAYSLLHLSPTPVLVVPSRK
jgi:nucleotide-binding universal stress UspA family protein